MANNANAAFSKDSLLGGESALQSAGVPGTLSGPTSEIETSLRELFSNEIHRGLTDCYADWAAASIAVVQQLIHLFHCIMKEDNPMRIDARCLLLSQSGAA